MTLTSAMEDALVKLVRSPYSNLHYGRNKLYVDIATQTAQGLERRGLAVLSGAGASVSGWNCGTITLNAAGRELGTRLSDARRAAAAVELSPPRGQLHLVR